MAFSFDSVPAVAALSALYRAPEPEVLAQLLPSVRLGPDEAAAVMRRAETIVASLRRAGPQPWMESFLQEYGLDSQEGLALLALAEAYLRAPDPFTADALLKDKLCGRDWASHLGASSSFFVNAASLGLTVADGLATEREGAFARLLARTSAPFVRRAVHAAVRVMGGQFVHGRTIEESLASAAAARPGPQLCSFDMLGEAACTATDAERYLESYRHAVLAAGAAAGPSRPLMQRHSISVKLSALHPRYEVAQADRCAPELVERVSDLAAEAAVGGIGLTIDAEETERLELSLAIIGAVARDPRLRGWDGLGMAIQAYQKRASAVVDWAAETSAAAGRRLAVRLVKGAYWDTEIKHAQERGLVDYPVFTTKAATDVSYLACARRMLATPHLQPAFATHNARTVATLVEWIGPRRDVEFQRLHGMGEALYRWVAANTGIGCRVYAPVGGYRELLAYLVRRLLENGANTSFVHQLADPAVPSVLLIGDPSERVAAADRQPNPAIPAPAALFGPERRNSEGIDLSDTLSLAELDAAFDVAWRRSHTAAPIIGGAESPGAPEPVCDPTDPRREIGRVTKAGAHEVGRAIGAADAALPDWSRRAVEARAAVLRRTADLLERDRAALMALLIREAGKTRADALAEVREAVDFCRYYAAEAERLDWRRLLPGPTGERNEMRLAARGVFACISPWNFPLAIFLGQVAAALVTGNTVVAKPAPQTPLIAAAAVRLLLEAGLPPQAVALVPGGPEVGEALCADPRVAGVCFTGSTGTARRIARTLLQDERRPLVPLIAETGGVNAMIVDSTALLEQVVGDAITSAFQSAGQRCSALRLLCLQEDIAKPAIEMLKGAMAELRVGDPAALSTDVGPVIDRAARDRIAAYVDTRRQDVLYQTPVPLDLPGWFSAPTLIRLDAPDSLKEEVFGPVLHVATWRAGELDALIDQINASGYGLTAGVHSRIRAVADRVRERARVGNVYVNRTIIGAVVGAQPFGGEGLSGTGPKAGGPHYLPRFCVERASSEDTTSAGGNASLMTLEV